MLKSLNAGSKTGIRSIHRWKNTLRTIHRQQYIKKVVATFATFLRPFLLRIPQNSKKTKNTP